MSLDNSVARNYKTLSPLSLTDRIHLKNRIYFAPMGIDVAHADGCTSEEMISFYKGIIDGGAGMVILGNASVHPSSRLQLRGLCLHNELHSRALVPLVRYGIEKNCQVVIQLQHYGAQGSTEYTGVPLLSPSGVPCPRMQKSDPNYRLREMTYEDMRAVTKQFVAAAKQAAATGCKMIQLQAANGYLLSSFLSPYTNKRNDAYGGSAEKRMTFLLEVIEAIRFALPEIAISIRLGIDDCLTKEGQRPELLAPHLKELEMVGIEALTCSISIGETFNSLLVPTKKMRERFYSGLRTIRAATELPLGFAGFVADCVEAESICSEIGVDLVGMTRALFADNDLITKTLSGNKEKILRCQFDGNCFRDKSNPVLDRVYCCVNPKYLRPSNISYNS